MALLTRDDLRRQSPFAWACMAALAGVAVLLWMLDKRSAAMGTAAGILGLLGIILPPRERMPHLPLRLRRLPRSLDAAPVLATLLSTPGYGLNWFHGANPYDEVVHLVSGLLAGAVFAGLVLADGVDRPRARMAILGLVFGLVLSLAWEGFEAALGIIGNTTDTLSDILLTTAGSAAGAALGVPLGAEEAVMRVATWNIHRGRPAFGRFHPDRIAAVLAEIRPDLIALQEGQHHFRRDDPMLDAARIEAECGLVPLRVDPLQQGWRGNVLLVRRDAKLLSGPRGLRLGGWEPRGGIQADLDLGDGPFRLLCAHLSLGAPRRRAQAAALLAAMKPGMPTLLMGDLNEWRPGGSALAVLAPAFGHPALVPSFPSLRPLLALDHILSHPIGLVAEVAVHGTKAARRASDHLPLVARFTPSG